MALEEEVMKQKDPAQPEKEDTSKLSDEEEKDLSIAVMMAQNVIDEGGIEVIDTAIAESSSPGEVIGQFIMQLVSQMSEQFPPDFTLSPRIWLAQGGFVEEISDYLQDEYDIPRDVMDKAEIFIAAQADSMAQGAVQQQTGAGPNAQQAQPQQATPTMPQQGGMV